MKFKSEEDINLTTDNIEEKCDCLLCKNMEIMSYQLDMIYNLINSLRSTLDTMSMLHEKHDKK